MYLAGDKAVCYVNSDNPREATFRKPEYSSGLWCVILPIIFIIIGLVYGFLAFRHMQLHKN